MDTIGDFITIIRNASTAGNISAKAQWSKIREGIANILKAEGYIADYRVVDNERGFKVIELALKYVNEEPAIRKIERISKPGCRLYSSHDSIPRELGGLGISILTTSKGVKANREAKREKLGGELLCRVW